MKLAFFSSSTLSLSLLKKLKDDFEVVLVITTKEKPDQNLAQKITELKIDLAVVIDYGLLIPKAVFDAPRFGTVNIHFSLLPKYRGPYPSAFVILKGEKTTGISFVLIDEGFDTGDILCQKEIKILERETAGELHQRLYRETEKIISYIIKLWADYKLGINSEQLTINNQQLNLFLPPQKQEHNLATYTKRLSREDGFIKWEKLLEADFSLFNLWRALSPWPGLWTEIEILSKIESGKDTSGVTRRGSPEVEEKRKRLKILKCHLEKDGLVLDQVQLEGKKPVGFKQFKEAYKLDFSLKRLRF